MANSGQELAKLIDAQLVVVETPCGHMGTDTGCEHAAVAEAVQQFLAH